MTIANQKIRQSYGMGSFKLHVTSQTPPIIRTLARNMILEWLVTQPLLPLGEESRGK